MRTCPGTSCAGNRRQPVLRARLSTNKSAGTLEEFEVVAWPEAATRPDGDRTRLDLSRAHPFARWSGGCAFQPSSAYRSTLSESSTSVVGLILLAVLLLATFVAASAAASGDRPPCRSGVAVGVVAGAWGAGRDPRRRPALHADEAAGMPQRGDGLMREGVTTWCQRVRQVDDPIGGVAMPIAVIMAMPSTWWSPPASTSVRARW